MHAHSSNMFNSFGMTHTRRSHPAFEFAAGIPLVPDGTGLTEGLLGLPRQVGADITKTKQDLAASLGKTTAGDGVVIAT